MITIVGNDGQKDFVSATTFSPHELHIIWVQTFSDCPESVWIQITESISEVEYMNAEGKIVWKKH